LAIIYGQIEVDRLLSDAGADINKEIGSEALNFFKIPNYSSAI